MAKHILFKFASRERPQKLIAGIENIIEFCENKQDFTILVSLDDDDRSVIRMFSNMIKIADFKKKYPNVELRFGLSKNKIDAINRDMKTAPRWDILVNFSDDMRWVVKGFDNIIREAFEKNPCSFLHVMDQHPYNNEIAAMSIMDWDYYQLDGYIYNPKYKSFFCDNEAFDVAKKRGKYVRIEQQLFSHDHPMWSKDFPVDKLYQKNNVFWREDKATYEKNKSINFNL